MVFLSLERKKKFIRVPLKRGRVNVLVINIFNICWLTRKKRAKSEDNRVANFRLNIN